MFDNCLNNPIRRAKNIEMFRYLVFDLLYICIDSIFYYGLLYINREGFFFLCNIGWLAEASYVILKFDISSEIGCDTLWSCLRVPKFWRDILPSSRGGRGATIVLVMTSRESIDEHVRRQDSSDYLAEHNFRVVISWKINLTR